MTSERTCKRCGKPIPKWMHGNRKYCCEYCRKAAFEDKRGSVRQQRTCPICGKQFANRRPDAKYCSTACYNKARNAPKYTSIVPRYLDEAQRALAALDDDQRENIRLLMGGAW